MFDEFFKTEEQIEEYKKSKQEDKRTFKFDVDSFSLPNSKNARAVLHLEADDDVDWEIEMPGNLANSLAVFPTYGTGSSDITFVSKENVSAYLPRVGELKATGTYRSGTKESAETKKVEVSCILTQETKYNMVEESLSPINNSIAMTLQDLVNATPCCADLVNNLLQWLDDNVLSYFSGLLDKAISPVTDLIGELSKEGEAIGALISFLNGGPPSDPTEVPSWCAKLIPCLKVMVKFSTLTIAQYVKMIKQVRAILADLQQYVIDIPMIITDRILGGGCREIIARVAPGLESFLTSFTAAFKTISDAITPVLEQFDRLLEIIKEFVFDLGGNLDFLAMLREFILDIKEKLHVALSPLAGCETIAYR